MEEYQFYALVSRMRYITRWGLMRNTFSENVQEHSHMVAVLAHALALIRRDILGMQADPERCAVAALFHDASEILTGDLPTPVKYYNPDIKTAYKQVEHVSGTRLLEMLQYQIADIDAVGPRAGEEEKLEAEKKRLQNAEHIAKSARLIRRALYRNDKGFSAFDLLERAEQALQGLQGVMEKAQDFANTVQEYRYELADIAESVAAFAEEDGEDPAKKLDRIEGRLEALSKLRRKYGADTEAVLAYRAQAAKRLAEIENADALAQEYEKTLQAQTKQALAAANALRDARRTAAERLCREMEREFSYLDMEKVRFSVCAEPRLDAAGQTVFAPDGIDTVRFLIATNPGEPFKPLSKIASGGELARVMLAAKSVLHAKDGATMVFDEVDSGVSGATSHKIGLKLRALGSAAPSAQVLCVTHSAQIAAVADAQYLIEKKVEDGRTYSGVRLLDKVQRIEELARIIAGNEITEAARQSARALLAEAKKENRDS